MSNIIFNNIIPISGYKCMALLPWIFVRNKCKDMFSNVDLNHEKIHLRQQSEMLAVGLLMTFVFVACGFEWWSLLALPIFFVWYVVEWFIRLCINGFNQNKAYHGISFEQEAYENEGDLYYLDSRSFFAWFKYLFKKNGT